MSTEVVSDESPISIYLNIWVWCLWPWRLSCSSSSRCWGCCSCGSSCCSCSCCSSGGRNSQNTLISIKLLKRWAARSFIIHFLIFVLRAGRETIVWWNINKINNTGRFFVSWVTWKGWSEIFQSYKHTF